MTIRGLILLTCAFFCVSTTDSTAQNDTIRLTNPSFEDFPIQGKLNGRGPRGWIDCGFPTETAPDVQPSPDPENPFFDVTQASYDGNTYMGMVVRKNDTWEAVGQRLRKPLKAKQCYDFSFYLSKSPRYVSSTLIPGVLADHKEPIKVRIWGGTRYCGKTELLDETELITHEDWRKYNLRFEPSENYTFIVIEAFYNQPTLIPYNGNILIDKASLIIQVPCDSEPLASIDESTANVNISPSKKPVNRPPDPPVIANTPSSPKVETPVGAKEKKLFNVDKKDLIEGQKLRINNLPFKADSSNISAASFNELNKIYRFLRDNRDVIVEFGGHTNDRCEHSFCDQLSTKRAKAVADYLVEKGISRRQIQYKGYGKHKPVATNKTPTGRKRNQRVEVKIISLGK